MELYSEWSSKLKNKTICREFDLLRTVDADHVRTGPTTPKDHQDTMDAQQEKYFESEDTEEDGSTAVAEVRSKRSYELASQ